MVGLLMLMIITKIQQFIREDDKYGSGILIIVDNNFETSIEGLYSIGDGGGLTRGLIMASASGVQMARILKNII